jgi:hypothetical protein
LLGSSQFSYASGSYNLTPPIEQKKVKKKRKWYHFFFKLNKKDKAAKVRSARVFSWIFFIASGFSLFFFLAPLFMPFLRASLTTMASIRLFSMIYETLSNITFISVFVGAVGNWITKIYPEKDRFVKTAFISSLIYVGILLALTIGAFIAAAVFMF